jgi:Zn-dependent protease with chaperone function
VSTQFFERQDAERSHTRWLVLGFIAAILAVVAICNAIVLVAVELNPARTLRAHPEIVFWVTAVVSLTILVASWHKASQLRQGGGVVARAAGGVHVLTNDPDFARQRLLNVVEEMSIAARVRKPMVFVLPDEPGINAFAAGNSPDDAAIAVTQGALDRLDRDQLQAVIGHELSHILNGDTKINMRLAAFIFGLFVITNIALRLMQNRGRGKRDSRLYVVALGVFVAGSTGMFAGRLLQAAVSRRREFLADASAVQFTRNPQALQGAFVAMAAHAEGTRLVHTVSADVAHMLIAGSDPAWADGYGGAWFATHPPLQARLQAIDGRVTPIRFRTLVSDEKRRYAAKQSPAPEDGALPAAGSTATAADNIAKEPAGNAATPAGPGPGSAAPVPMSVPLAGAAVTTVARAPDETFAPGAVSLPDVELPAPEPPNEPGVTDAAADLRILATAEMEAPRLRETASPDERRAGGRLLPPDPLRDRLSDEQQASIAALVSEVESAPIAVQGTFVAAMLASEPAKWRTQLVKLAPVLGIELMKATQAQIARFAQLAPAARVPAISDLLALLDDVDAAGRKRLRAVARAFAPTVAAGDMRRFTVTRVLDRKLAKPRAAPAPASLADRAADVCTLFAALAQCRFGPGKQGTNAYRAGLMGMMPAKAWTPYPDDALANAQLDAALSGLAGLDDANRRALADGMARVLAVGGRLTVPQVDLLRGACLVLGCALPAVPADVAFEDPLEGAAQANAR